MSCLYEITGGMRRSTFRSKYFGGSLLTLRTYFIVM